MEECRKKVKKNKMMSFNFIIFGAEHINYVFKKYRECSFGKYRNSAYHKNEEQFQFCLFPELPEPFKIL